MITSCTDKEFLSQKNKFCYIHQVSIYRKPWQRKRPATCQWDSDGTMHGNKLIHNDKKEQHRAVLHVKYEKFRVPIEFGYGVILQVKYEKFPIYRVQFKGRITSQTW